MGNTLATVSRSLVYVVTRDDLPGDRLRTLRTDRNLGLRELARLTESAVTHVQLANIENSITPWSGVKFGTIEGIARGLNMPVSEFLRVVTGRSSEVTEIVGGQAGKRRIPVYNLVSAGNGTDGGEIVDYIEIDAKKSGERVAYLIDGDSMASRIMPGATVEVLVQNTAKVGHIIVCYAPEHGMLCKLLTSVTPDGYLVLSSYNEAYGPITVAASDCHIKGVVKEIRNPAPCPDDTKLN